MEEPVRRRRGSWTLMAALLALAALGAALAVRHRLNQSSAAAAPALVSIKLATTTSTDNSGLLDVLLPAFRARSGIEVRVIAAGSGKALKLGEAGDVDVVLVHARAAEDEFVARGFGVNREDVMFNDFVICGPPADPASIRGMNDAPAALRTIAEARAPFVSRGDDSGTHKKELELLAAAGVKPEGDWYLSTGQGMGETLVIAGEKRGYTLSDRGTFVAFEGKVGLEVLCEGDPRLFNPYGVIAVNPAKHPDVRYRAAMTFIDWLVSPEGRRSIAGFKKNGKQLFFPSPARE